MKRHHKHENDTEGYDSFLDIVANLVGILVILIMVLGVRAKEAWQRADESPIEVVATNTFSEPMAADLEDSQVDETKSEVFEEYEAVVAVELDPESDVDPNGVVLPPPDLDVTYQGDIPSQEDITVAPVTASPELLDIPDVETARRQAEEMRLAAHETDAQIAALDQQVALQQAYRDELLVALTVGKQQVEAHREQLSEAEAKQAAEREVLQSARQQLTNLQRQVKDFDLAPPEPIVLTHRPPPLAKTVFGREEHFRLHNGLIVHVPMREIGDRLQNEMKNKMWKLKETPQIMETFGPLGDFYVRYLLVRSERKIRTETGPLVRTVVELDHFELQPVTETLGVPVSTALQSGSSFDQRLSQYDASEVTITVWTYPDSYAELRQLKESLWKRGFLVAARPLQAGIPISGSPHGTRSAAE